MSEDQRSGEIRCRTLTYDFTDGSAAEAGDGRESRVSGGDPAPRGEGAAPSLHSVAIVTAAVERAALRELRCRTLTYDLRTALRRREQEMRSLVPAGG